MNKLKKPTAQQFANWLGHDLETVNAAISTVKMSDPDAAYTTAEDMGHEEIAEVISEIYFEYGSLKEALIACAEDLAEGTNLDEGILDFFKKKPKAPQKDYVKEIKNGANLNSVPEEFRTYEICELAMRGKRGSLKEVPLKFRDYRMCNIAVNANGANLHYVPDELKDQRMCDIAVNDHTGAYDAVPDKYKTPEMALKVAREDWEMFEYIPEKDLTYEICLIAVKKAGYLLEKVPIKFRDYKLCFTAVKRDGWAIKFVPGQHLNYELCLEAVKAYPKAINDVPEHFRDRIKKESGIAPDRFEVNESSKRKTRLREEEEPYIQVIPKKLDIYHEVILPMEKAFKNLKVDEILRTRELITKDKIYYEGYNNGVDMCIKKIRNFDIYSNKDPKVVLNELYNLLEKISRSAAGTDHPFHHGFLRASGKCKDIFYEEVMEKFVFDK